MTKIFFLLKSVTSFEQLLENFKLADLMRELKQ